jgi:hypothetical protein
MYFSTFLKFFTALSLASSAAIQPSLQHRTLTEDDIIVWGANRVEVMNKSSYALLKSQASSSVNLTTSPTVYNATSMTSTDTSLSSRTLSSRCSKETIYTVNPPTTFLNWDVPMSSVLKAGSTGTTTVSVTAGYSIANSVSATASVTLIAEFLQSSFSVSYSETWTSTYAAAYSFQIPAGKYGAVVSNPQTTRRTGTVAIGCVAEATTTAFQADSYTSQAYGGLSWVEGTITLCTGDTYPLPRCTGSGTLS